MTQHSSKLTGLVTSIVVISLGWLLAAAGCGNADPVEQTLETPGTARASAPGTAISSSNTPTVSSLARTLVPGCEERVPEVYIVQLNVDPGRAPDDTYTLGGATIEDVAAAMAEEHSLTVT